MTFADLLVCHDCLNNMFSDITYKESSLVIPGMPTFADLLVCHDCLNNMFSDITYKESSLVIPGMPDVTTTKTSETLQSSRSSEQSSRIPDFYCQISDDQMAVSSLSQSRALAPHQTNVHDIIKVQANEKRRSIPTSHWHCTQNC